MKSLKLLLLILMCMTVQLSAQQVVNTPELKTGRAAGGSVESKFKKSPKKIMINAFRVNYQILYTDWEGTRAGVYSGATSAELSVGFEGMEEADFQQLTDQLYADYLADLKSKGYEIVTMDVLSGHKAVNKHNLMTGGTADYNRKDGFISTTPTGMQFYSNDKGRPPLAGKMKGVEAVVIDVKINVPFIVDAESGASKLATSAVGGVSKIVVKPALRISPYSKVTFVDPAFLAVTNAVMKKALGISGVFQDEKFKASAAAQSNTSYDMGHITRVYSTDVNTSKIQVAKCDPEKYKTGVAEGMMIYLRAANDRFISFTEK